MAELDLCIKKLLQDRERFSDLYNAEVFHGKQILKAENLTPISNESGIMITDSKNVKRAVQRQRDVVMMASFGMTFAITAVEGQGQVHYAMPVRSMTYDALDYTEQIQKMEKGHKEVDDPISGAEFLSHVTKDDRLVPIVNLILYYGKDIWDGPRSLYDMMGLDKNWEGTEALEKFLPNYSIHIVDARNIDELERFHTSLQQVFGMLKYNSDKKKLYEYAKQNQDGIRKMDEASMTAMLILLGEQKRLMEIWKMPKEEEEKDLCIAIDELIADGEARGEIRGEAKGEAKGEINGVGKMAKLISALITDNKVDLLADAAKDEQLRCRLFEQYHL